LERRSWPNNRGRDLAVELLSSRRSELLDRVVAQDTPPSPYYSFLKMTRKKYFNAYFDYLREAVENGDTTDLLGNETFQSYSHAKNGFQLKEVLQVPVCVKHVLLGMLGEMAEAGDVSPAAAVEAAGLLVDVLDEAETIRAQSFIQTRDEEVRFFHQYQEEIDRFPANLAATLDFTTLLSSSIKKCTELVDAGRCAIFTRDLATDDFQLKASNFEMLKLMGDRFIDLDEQVKVQLMSMKQPVLIEGYRRSLPKLTSLMKRMKTKTILLVPLMVRDRNVGIILLDSVDRPQMFTPEVVNLTMRFANKVAAAMENARLHGSEQQKLKETMALLEVARLVTSTLDIDILLNRLVQITADVCEVCKCSVYVYLEESNRFYPTATFGVLPDCEWETSMGEGVSPTDLQDEDAEKIVGEHLVAITDPKLSPFIPEDRIDETQTRSVVLVPIFSRENLLGMITLFYSKERDELEQDDLNLVTAVAGQAAVALENASLYENLEMSYFSTVKALARAIEVKDPYTYGHSERVTEYALAIARRLGVSEWESKNIKYAAALHDIGKIGIARKILDKPGALNDEEFVHIKTHPQLGDSIIEPVAFLQEPRQIILHHHERYDGTGYPDGLTGDEIPLGARILAVADSFEAMMSNRPYRKALPLEKAISELEVNAGTQFDPVVVEAFIDVLHGGAFHSEEAERTGVTIEPPD